MRGVTVHIDFVGWRTVMDWAWLWVGESRINSHIILCDMREGFWNNYLLRFWGCENIIVGGEFIGNYGAVLLSQKELLLLLCLGVRYLVSNLVKILTILEMKVLSFLLSIV